MSLRRDIKHWFIPHKHNDHRPHLIRGHGLVVMAALLLTIQVAAFAVQPPAAKLTQGNVLAYASNITIADLLALTNQERVANGLPALRLDSKLNQSATLKAHNMFEENYWAHVSPSGLQPWHWFGQAGYTYKYAGENLAKDFDTSSGAVAGWMNSPGHRANILNANYVDVGFAIENGTLVGGQTSLVVAHYGATNGVSVAAIVSAPTPARTPIPTTPRPATPNPTPVATPIATPTSTPVVLAPATTPTPELAVAPNGSVTPGAPTPTRYTLFQPLSVVSTLSWGTLATIALLLLLLLVYGFTHLAVWRKGLKRWRSHHYRWLAAVQIVGLVALLLYLATSGFGQVI